MPNGRAGELDSTTCSCTTQNHNHTLRELSLIGLCTASSCASNSNQHTANSEATPVPSGTPQLSPHFLHTQADPDSSPFSAGLSTSKRAHAERTPNAMAHTSDVGAAGSSFSAYREPHPHPELQLPANEEQRRHHVQHYNWRSILASHSSKRLLLDATLEA